MFLVPSSGCENLPGTRVWVWRVQVRVSCELPVPNPYLSHGFGGFFSYLFEGLAGFLAYLFVFFCSTTVLIQNFQQLRVTAMFSYAGNVTLQM